MDALLALRDQIVGSRRFQTFAARFPPTRPIARRRTKALFDLCAGFVYSQILFACVSLDLFEQVAARPLDVAQLAANCAMPQDAMRCLLDAAASLDLLAERRGGRFGLGSQGAALRGNPAIGAMIAHHAMLYDDLSDPVAMLRTPKSGPQASGGGGRISGAGTRLRDYWGYAGGVNADALGTERVRAYTALMGASQPMISDEVLAAYDFGRHRCLLDVGGGDGSFLRAVARQAPGIELLLFDLPAVAHLARAQFAAAGLDGRVRCVGGDFSTKSFPPGADIVSFVRVLHDHDDAPVRELLHRARAALSAGGTLLIAEPMADIAGSAAYFRLYLHAMGSGLPRRARRLMQMVREAGFDRPRLLRTPTPLLAQVIVASARASA